MKKSVKLIALLMAVTMIVSSMFTCLVASAADPVGTITVGTNDQVKVGDTTATVDITIDFTKDITAPHDLFTLTAPTGFTLTAAEVKNVVYTTRPEGSAGVTIDAEDGADLAAGKILLESPVDTKAPVVSKIVVTATYAIADTVEAGTHTITVDSEIADITESDLTLEEVNGAIVVAEAHTCAPAGEPKIENEVAATCYAEGSYDSVVYCSCGKELSRDTLPIAKIAHTPAEAVVENNVDATCYAEGSYDSVVYCAVEACKAEISRTPVTVEKTEHTPAEAVVENNVDATCYAEGSYDSVVYCAVAECKHEISRTPVTVEKIAHTPAAPVEENRVEAKPGVAGSYDSVVYCSVEACKAEISRTTNEIPALPEEEVCEHANKTFVSATPAVNGGDNGSIQFSCDDCGETLAPETVAYLNTSCLGTAAIECSAETKLLLNVTTSLYATSTKGILVVTRKFANGADDKVTVYTMDDATFASNTYTWSIGVATVNFCDEFVTNFYTLRDGQWVSGLERTYSVVAAATSAVQKSSNPEKTKKMAANLLKVGQEAQAKFAASIEAKPMDSLTANDIAYVSTAVPTVEKTASNFISVPTDYATTRKAVIATPSVALKDAITMNFRVVTNYYDGPVDDVKVKITYETYNGVTVERFVDFTSNSGKIYNFELALTAPNLRQAVTFQAYNGDTPISENATYSVEAILAHALASDSTLKPVINAIMNYSDSTR